MQIEYVEIKRRYFIDHGRLTVKIKGKRMLNGEFSNYWIYYL